MFDDDKPSGSPAPVDSQQPATLPGDSGTLSQDSTNPVVSPAGGFPRSTTDQVNDAHADEPPPEPHSNDHPKEISGDLLEVRRKALSDLEPIIDQLDLEPEEKFKTLMMMIQSTDNQSLVDHAYQAAHDIKGEKERAEALLDIVNEINYFTNHPRD